MKVLIVEDVLLLVIVYGYYLICVGMEMIYVEMGKDVLVWVCKGNILVVFLDF